MLGSPVTIVEPVAEPLDLAAAKRFLRVDGDSLDGDVELAMVAAREEIEARTGLRLVDQLVEIRADAFTDLTALPVGPVRGVTEIRYVDRLGAIQLLDASLYELLGSGLERGIAPAIGAQLPAMLAGRGGIVVHLLVGYGEEGDAVPSNVRHALLALTRGKYDDRQVNIDPLITNMCVFA